MENLNEVTITTNELELVPTSQQYSPDIFREFSEDITTFMMPESPKKIEETQEYVASAIQKIEQGKDLTVVVLNKTTREFLGCAGLHNIDTETPELGIWIKKSAHGHGFGREAVTALKEWADKHLDYKYLRYPVDKRNIPSRKIPESLGGIVEGEEYTATTSKGRVLEEVEYRIYKNQPE